MPLVFLGISDIAMLIIAAVHRQLGRTIDCFVPWAAGVAPSDTVRANPQKGTSGSGLA